MLYTLPAAVVLGMHFPLCHSSLRTRAAASRTSLAPISREGKRFDIAPRNLRPGEISLVRAVHNGENSARRAAANRFQCTICKCCGGSLFRRTAGGRISELELGYRRASATELVSRKAAAAAMPCITGNCTETVGP